MHLKFQMKYHLSKLKYNINNIKCDFEDLG